MSDQTIRPGRRRAEAKTPPGRIALYVGLGLCLCAGLFWLTWKSQFAAPPGYLFNTPTQPIEAGYCLAVARALSGGMGGGYIGEAQDFWLKRVLEFSGDVAGNIAKGEAGLGRHLIAHEGPDRTWLIEAMDACSNRAVNYGARFRAFD